MARTRRMNAERQEALQEKRKQALQLRKNGVTYEQIARTLGYADGSGAYYAVKEALAAITSEPAKEVRQLELERLDALWLIFYPKAKGGDRLALDRCLLIQDRRARYLGLDAPTRRIVEVVTEDEFARVMKELEREVAEMEDEGISADPVEWADRA